MESIPVLVVERPNSARVSSKEVLDAALRGKILEAAAELCHLWAESEDIACTRIFQVDRTLSTLIDHERVASVVPKAVAPKLKLRVLQLLEDST